ncbi:hypothetical protein [Thioclava sp. GXIMD4215]|uniref:hypothetical protein n=1 Tax=Thioclava sp. GXIMD4215 TaxID=3131928 RepID=UPI00324A2E94
MFKWSRHISGGKSQSSKVTEEIGKLLWKVFPPEAKAIVFWARFGSGGHGSRLDWLDDAGNRIGPMGSKATPFDAMRAIETLALNLRRTPPFDRDPFTHMRVELTEKGKMNINFAHIPEWDSWMGLFMRGVSELSEEEARNPELSNTWGIDLEHWQKCRARREQEPYEK